MRRGWMVVCLLLGLGLRLEAGLVEASRMRLGELDGRPVREFSGDVRLELEAGRIACREAFFYPDGAWLGRATRFELPGIRIDSAEARGDSRGIAEWASGEMVFLLMGLRLEFGRCRMLGPEVFLLDEVIFWLGNSKETRVVPHLAIHLQKKGVVFDLPGERIYRASLPAKFQSWLRERLK